MESFKKGSKEFQNIVDGRFKTAENYFESTVSADGFPKCGFANY
jgi:hypothetical protein